MRRCSYKLTTGPDLRPPRLPVAHAAFTMETFDAFQTLDPGPF